MRTTLLFLLLVLSIEIHAEVEPFRENYTVDSVKSNLGLASNKAKVIVRVTNANFIKGEKILYGYESAGFEAYLNDNKSFQFTLDSGYQSLQFYPPTKIGYEELFTLPIQFKARTTTYISLDFQIISTQPLSIKKPVIYFYPTKETAISATINPKGNLSFTYPTAPTGTWEFTANHSGELRMADNTYNYLFWEADQVLEDEQLDDVVATTVSKDQLLDYLEMNLETFGFTSKEKMDFITFWAPQMMHYEATSIRFLINEECAIFADLEIVPAPDHVLRFYMIWSPSDLIEATTHPVSLLRAQDRSGYTVLEWGGTEIPRNQEKSR